MCGRLLRMNALGNIIIVWRNCEIIAVHRQFVDNYLYVTCVPHCILMYCAAHCMLMFIHVDRY